MDDECNNVPSTTADRDIVNIQSGRADFRGATIGGGVSDDTLKKIVDAITGASTPRNPPSVRNNFADAKIIWNRLFTGRENDLAQLHQAISNKSQVITHAVTGAGGVGKTELARAFAFIFADEFDGVWWIDASDGGFSKSISRLYRTLKGKPAPENSQPEDLAQELSAYWSQGRHLVVLDNLGSRELLALFALSDTCRVLATTRTDLSAAAIVETFTVDVISEEAAVQLMVKQTKNRKLPIPESDLRAIAVELGCHTLAVALGGAYLSRYGDMSAIEYLAQLRSLGLGEVSPRQEGEERDPLLLRYRHSVRSCLTLHFNRFEGGKELTLLQLSSFCHSNDIPLGLLIKVGEFELDEVRTLARNLADASIVQYDATISIHRLTQSVVRSMLDDQTRNRMITQLAEILANAFEDVHDDRRLRIQTVLAPHAEALIGHAARWHPSSPAGKLANNLIAFIREAGQFRAFERISETALNLTRTMFTDNSANMAVLLNNIAMTELELGKIPEARVKVERAIEICKGNPDIKPSVLSSTYSTLAMICSEEGSLREARSNIDRSIGLARVNAEKDDYIFATLYNNLSTIQIKEEKYKEAIGSMKKSIAIELKYRNKNAPIFSMRFGNLSAAQIHAGDLDGARSSIIQTIAIQRMHWPDNHISFATTYNTVAHIEYEAGNRTEACTNWKRALAILLRHFGETHPNVIATRNSLRTAGCGES